MCVCVCVCVCGGGGGPRQPGFGSWKVCEGGRPVEGQMLIGPLQLVHVHLRTRSEHLHAALGWVCQSQLGLEEQVRAVAAAAAQGMGAGLREAQGWPLWTSRPAIAVCATALPLCTRCADVHAGQQVPIHRGCCVMMCMPCAACGCMPCAAGRCMLTGAGTHVAWRTGDVQVWRTPRTPGALATHLQLQVLVQATTHVQDATAVLGAVVQKVHGV